MLLDLKYKNINEILSFQAKALYNKEFLIDQHSNRKYSFREADHITNKVAKTLMDYDVHQGDNVCLIIGNSIEFVLLYLSLLRIGAVVIPINPTMKQSGVENILLHSEAKLLISSSDELDYKIIRENSPSLTIWRLTDNEFFKTIETSQSKEQNVSSGNTSINTTDSPAVILYTSGTTGDPKGVVLTQLNLLSNAIGIANALKLEDNRMLCILPLHHTNGQIINILSPLLSGGSVVVSDSYTVFNLAQIWDTISLYNINIVDVVPTILSILLRIKTRREVDISSLKYFICGAAPLPINLQDDFQRRFGCIVLQEYGLTEATCVSSINSLTNRKVGSIGLPLGDIQMKIINEYGEDQPNGITGEIIIKGDSVMKGYFKRPDLTNAMIKDGWLHTGDLGKFDDDGFVYIVGRKRDIIIKGGENIYPIDIENILYRHPAIADCAVVGTQNEIYGEEIKVYIVLKEGSKMDAKDLIRFCEGKLPAFWCPKEVVFVNTIPRTPSGKVLKRELS